MAIDVNDRWIENITVFAEHQNPDWRPSRLRYIRIRILLPHSG